MTSDLPCFTRSEQEGIESSLPDQAPVVASPLRAGTQGMTPERASGGGSAGVGMEGPGARVRVRRGLAREAPIP